MWAKASAVPRGRYLSVDEKGHIKSSHRVRIKGPQTLSGMLLPESFIRDTYIPKKRAGGAKKVRGVGEGEEDDLH